MRRFLGFLGGTLFTLLLLVTMAILNGREERPKVEPATGWAVTLTQFKPQEAQRRESPPPERPRERPRRIPEVSLSPLPEVKTPPLRLEPPPLALLQDLDLPLSSDLPEELFRYEGPPQSSPSPTAYEVTEVDTPPYPIRRPLPPYPREAKRRGIEGEVRVRVLVDRSGKVVKVEVVEARPKGVFEEAVVRTLKGWEFRPALKGGRPVDAWVAIPIRFELREG